MAKKQGKQDQKHLKINICHVTTADSDARLSRAIDILLRSAIRDMPVSENSIEDKKDEPLQKDIAEES